MKAYRSSGYCLEVERQAHDLGRLKQEQHSLTRTQIYFAAYGRRFFRLMKGIRINDLWSADRFR